MIIFIVEWIPSYSEAGSHINFSIISSCKDNVEVERSIAVDNSLKWRVFVHGKEVKNLPESLATTPSSLSSVSDLRKIMNIICSFVLCVGNADPKYLPLLSSKKEPRRFYDIAGKQ